MSLNFVLLCRYSVVRRIPRWLCSLVCSWGLSILPLGVLCRHIRCLLWCCLQFCCLRVCIPLLRPISWFFLLCICSLWCLCCLFPSVYFFTCSQGFQAFYFPFDTIYVDSCYVQGFVFPHPPSFGSIVGLYMFVFRFYYIYFWFSVGGFCLVIHCTLFTFSWGVTCVDFVCFCF